MPSAGALIIRELTGTLKREVRLEGRSGPLQPQETPIEHDMKLTKYPGHDEKSVQMLGAAEDPVTFRGKVRDRYTAAGFASAVKDTLRAINKSGEILEVENLDWKRQCVMRRFVPLVYWEGHLDYEVIFEVLGTGNDSTTLTVAPTTVETPEDMTRGVQQGMDNVETAQSADFLGRVDDVFEEIDAAIVSARDLVDGLVAEYVIPTQQLVEQGAETARRAAAASSAARDSIRTALAGLRAITPATATVLASGIDLIQSASYLGELGQACRQFVVSAQAAALFFQERGGERVLTKIIGKAGRPLSELSMRYYGTPHDWVRIARANGLRDNLVVSSVELIIPA